MEEHQQEDKTKQNQTVLNQQVVPLQINANKPLFSFKKQRFLKTKQKRSNKGTNKVPKQELASGLYLENKATPEIESKHMRSPLPPESTSK